VEEFEKPAQRDVGMHSPPDSRWIVAGSDEVGVRDRLKAQLREYNSALDGVGVISIEVVAQRDPQGRVVGWVLP
jgi:hypothetical protein